MAINLPPLPSGPPPTTVDTTSRNVGSPGISPASSAKPFSEVIESIITDVNESQQASAQSAKQLATGEISIDEAMITMEKADLQFRMVAQVRNKVVEAYREVMRMNF